MASEIIINRGIAETRVAKLENGQLCEFQIERDHEKSYVGNIYRGKVSRVLPGMQAAFLDVGLERNAFLYVKNIMDNTKDVNEMSGDDDLARGPETQNDIDPEEMISSPQETHTDISKLIREGEYLMVQVVKDPMGTKGARLTGYVRIPGRYLVYMPENRCIGLSRRIDDMAERDRLRDILEKNMPSQGGFIVRTVAEGASAKNLKDDMEYLIKIWSTIKKSFDKQNTVGLVHADLDLATRTIRDRVTEDVEKIVVDDLESFKKMNKFIQNYVPKFKKRIEVFTGTGPMYESYGIELELARALNRKVWLKSGGYIIIDQTEALVAVDVNTGRFTGRNRNLEDTVMQTNMEAVKEIAYQVRLRNLGGIIIVDFIDMDKPQNREQVYSSFVEELKKDPVKTQVYPISELGLIQMTRKRSQESLMMKLMDPCGYCDSRGYLKSKMTVAYQILRECKKEASVSKNSGSTLTVYCHSKIAAFFAEEERATLEKLEAEIGAKVMIKIDPKIHIEEYEIFSRDA